MRVGKINSLSRDVGEEAEEEDLGFPRVTLTLRILWNLFSYQCCVFLSLLSSILNNSSSS